MTLVDFLGVTEVEIIDHRFFRFNNKVMKYLTVDGMFSGTGIRDSIEGAYLDSDDLGLSPELTRRISNWLDRYENAHYAQFKDKLEISELDTEGLEICLALKNELPDSKVEYYSSALMGKLPVEAE